jgi:hypothetical protein
MKTRKKAGSSVRPRQRKAAQGAGDRSPAGSRILAAIEEATELLRSEGLESKRLTVHTYRLPPAPRDYRPDGHQSACGSGSGRARRCWRGSWA